MSRPVCIACSTCRAVLANNGDSVPWNMADGDLRIQGFRSNGEADEAARSAGWRVIAGDYEPGEVTFAQAAQGEHYCPDCQRSHHGHQSRPRRVPRTQKKGSLQ